MADFTVNNDKLENFKRKYPELIKKFKIENGIFGDELHFIISNEKEIHKKNWTFDFLESNVNSGRLTNGVEKISRLFL